MYGGRLLALHVETWNAQRNFVGKTLSNFAYEMGNEIKRQILPGAVKCRLDETGSRTHRAF